MRYSVMLSMVMLFTRSLNAQDTDSSSYEETGEYSGESTTESFYRPVNPGEVSQKKGYDTEPISVQRFDRKKWKETVGDKDYSEEQRSLKRKQENPDSSYSNSSRSTKRLVKEEGDDEAADDKSSSIGGPIVSTILNIIFYVLVFVIIGYILFLILRNTSLRSNPKIPKTGSYDHTTHVEDIKELEIDRLLREAMTSGNYRLAIRICFLGLLKQLDEDGFIVWKKNKTNRDYLSQLFSKVHYYEEIRSLTFAYEQVWYGDHNLPVQTYEQIISSFKAIDHKLKAAKPGEKR